VIFVGDRGLVSDKTLSKLEELDCGYVIAARLKSLSSKVKDEIASDEGWEELTEDLKVKELYINHRRLVVYKSKELEEEHKRVRMEILDEIKEKMLKSLGGKITPLGRKAKKYLKGECKVEFDVEAIREDEKLDGCFGFWCRGKEVTKKDAYRAYRLLWQVEDTFRSMKSHLKVRPMYHWTPKRIKGHVVMCYLAFCVMKALERRLKEAGIDVSIREALEELNEVMAVEVETAKERFVARTEIKGLKNQLLRAFRVKIPKPILEKEPKRKNQSTKQVRLSL